MIGGPLVAQHGEHFELFLSLGGRTGWNRPEQRQLTSFQRLWCVVVDSTPEQDALRFVKGDRQGIKRSPAGLCQVSLYRGNVPLIHVRPPCEIGLGQTARLTQTSQSPTDALLCAAINGNAGVGHAHKLNARNPEGNMR